jgi:hypothetical protein
MKIITRNHITTTEYHLEGQSLKRQNYGGWFVSKEHLICVKRRLFRSVFELKSNVIYNICDDMVMYVKDFKDKDFKDFKDVKIVEIDDVLFFVNKPRIIVTTVDGGKHVKFFDCDQKLMIELTKNDLYWEF